MDREVDTEALAAIRTIDLTTVGRWSGRPARIEIWWFRIDGRFIITGTPGRRDWYANVRANPAITVHAGGADYPGRAVPITDIERRRAVFTHPETSWYETQTELARLVSAAPMIEVTLDGEA
jgi:deazaflavin-dependent oxidoreductase (nitroreductase family)